MSEVVAKVLVGHSADCYAIENTMKGQWRSPWAYFTNESVYLDSIGRKQRGAHWRWIKASCNCRGCPAIVIAREDTLLQQLPAGRP